MRPVALGRMGSAAIIYTLIETAKMNRIDSRAWLTDLIARISDHPANKINDLMPWCFDQTQV